MGIHYLQMRIGFDIRPFLREETGVGVYFRNLLFSLAKIDKSNEYFLFSSSLKDRFNPKKIPPLKKKHFREFSYPAKVVNFFWHRLGWPPLDFFFKNRLDLTHSPIPLILPTRGKKIVTVYDLFFMDFPLMTNREARKVFFKKIQSSLDEADGVISISKFTKDQLIQRFGLEEEKVKVIYPGLNPKFREDISPDEAEETRKKFSLPPSFILFVGAIEPRKNLPILVEALKIIHEKDDKITLVIIGHKGQDWNRLQKKVKQYNLRPWVKMLGYQSERDVQTLYRLASVFVFPSLCEGFGIPLIEAMASGLPVAASRISVIPEVSKDAAVYFHPDEPEDIAEKIVLILKDNDLRKVLIERGRERSSDFDWESSAAETLSFYEEISQGGGCENSRRWL